MKKGLIALFAAFLLTGCGRTQSATITNPITLNTTTADMSGYTRLQDSDHVFQALSIKESLRMFDEKGSGIIYFGKPDCDYCQCAVPELNTAAKTMGVDVVYYVDVTNAETDDSYEDLKKAIESTFKTNTSGQKAFMVPEVIAVKNGSIVDSHLALTSDYKVDSYYIDLNETQKLQLQDIYKELMREAAD